MREYLLIMAVAIAVAFLMVGPAGALAFRVGAVPPTRARDVHRVPIPRLGGTAIMAALLAAFAVAHALPKLGEVTASSQDVRALVTGGVIIFLLGFIDDIVELDSLTKFAGQVIAAGAMVVQGLQLYWIPLPGGPLVLTPLMSAAVTMGIVLVTVNAVNFIDGLDGLAAGVVGIGSAAFFAYSYSLAAVEGLSRMLTPALITIALTGACAGFLIHNGHPAKIFMGDSGSMLIGLCLAGGTIAMTGQLDSQAVPSASFLPSVLPLLLPVAVLAIPFLDLFMAVHRRTGAGRSMFSADKQHLHHRLLERGHSHRRAVAIMWSWTALVAFGTVIVSVFETPLTIALVTGAFLIVLAITLDHPRGFWSFEVPNSTRRDPDPAEPLELP